MAVQDVNEMSLKGLTQDEMMAAQAVRPLWSHSAQLHACVQPRA